MRSSRRPTWVSEVKAMPMTCKRKNANNPRQIGLRRKASIFDLYLPSISQAAAMQNCPTLIKKVDKGIPKAINIKPVKYRFWLMLALVIGIKD